MLFLVIAIWGFNRTIGNPEYVKQTFEETAVFDSVAEFIQDEITDQVGKDKEGKLIRQVVEDTAKPETLGEVISGGVDEVYRILEGEVDPEDFQLDVSALTDALEKNTKARLKERLLKLEPCTSSNPSNSINPYEFNCLPFGSSVDTYVDMAVALTKTQNDVLRTGVVDINSLDVNESGEVDKEQNIDFLRRFSSAYQAIQSVYWIAIVLTIVSGIGVVFLSKQFIKGLRRLGSILFGNGLIFATVAFIVRVVSNQILVNETRSDPLNSFQKAGNQLVVDYANITIQLSIVVALLGATLFIVATIIIRNNKKVEDQADEESLDVKTSSNKAEEQIKTKKTSKQEKSKTKSPKKKQ